MKYFLIALLFSLIFITPHTASAHEGDEQAGTTAAEISSMSAGEITVDGDDSLVTERIEEENPLPHLNQITLYLLIALAGIAAGSIATFLLLTFTLHPKQ